MVIQDILPLTCTHIDLTHKNSVADLSVGKVNASIAEEGELEGEWSITNMVIIVHLVPLDRELVLYEM